MGSGADSGCRVQRACLLVWPLPPRDGVTSPPFGASPVRNTVNKSVGSGGGPCTPCSKSMPSSLASAWGKGDVATFWHVPGPETTLIWNVLRSEGRSDVNLASVSSTTRQLHIINASADETKPLQRRQVHASCL